MDDGARPISLRRSFFEDLWPLILQPEENPCDISHENRVSFYKPQIRFDAVWAHEILAAGRFQNYVKPITFRGSSLLWKRPTWMQSDEESEPDVDVRPYEPRPVKIEPIAQIMAKMDQAEEDTRRVIKQYENRTLPWYYIRDNHEYNYDMNGELRAAYDDNELEIIRNIYKYQVRFIIMDMGIHVDATKLDKWWKFLNFVHIIAIVRDKILVRQLPFLKNFDAILAEENLENTWQEELDSSLEMGVERAKKLEILGHCAKPFIFVFSSKRGMTACDTFKILCRDII